MLPEIKRCRGGQPGNQNARKHGYYSSVLTREDRAKLKEASDIVGLDDEIALLRARLKSVIEHDPDNIRLISQAASTLARLMRTNHKLGFNKTESLEQARWNVIYNYGSQFGWDIKTITDLFLGKAEFLHKPLP